MFASPLCGLSASITAMCHAASMAEPSFVIEFGSMPLPAPNDGDAQTPLSRLTSSERDVARIISEGVSNEEVAERLGKTIHAVKFQLHRIYRKLGVPIGRDWRSY